MSEEHVLILIRKCCRGQLVEGLITGQLCVEDNFEDQDKGLVISAINCRNAVIFQLDKLVETWKSHDSVNFVKSAAVTHILDFNAADASSTELSGQFARFETGSEDVECVSKLSDYSRDSGAEGTVVHTLVHGISKIDAVVSFSEAFVEDSSPER
ncbi:uncharacterized protein MICPUCDRAFT_70688 [Micromonas pusilla CCMP1545]|uniref:Uncharacterized protein HYP12 n=1 Tax=Micromonas pusilla (strain CCMP1545) TaxID=564608 RepID=C1MKG5_MICPC|nr:uncharacterized protein MICPUCDRAFT_70688 [Micromonas pusilla CCMP1545]EEH59371.1 hypothetical protein MICPUCDRAFT_70688 [Micromonas pusilla CCMP1545]|eukprot:XP_003055995.1 hypothetical protein MICPUCDRAFT_70688 [Micromonas pusilla CCMP1545]